MDFPERTGRLHMSTNLHSRDPINPHVAEQISLDPAIVVLSPKRFEQLAPQIASPADTSWAAAAFQRVGCARRATRDCHTFRAGSPKNSKAIAAMKIGCGRPVVLHETTRARPPMKETAVSVLKN